MLLLWRWLRLFTGLALLHLLGALLLLLHLVALALGCFVLLALVLVTLLLTGLALLVLLGTLLLLLCLHRLIGCLLFLNLFTLTLDCFALLALLVTLEPLRLLCRTTLWRGRRLHSRRRDGHVFLRLLAQGVLSRRCFGWLALGVLLPG